MVTSEDEVNDSNSVVEATESVEEDKSSVVVCSESWLVFSVTSSSVVVCVGLLVKASFEVVEESKAEDVKSKAVVDASAVAVMVVKAGLAKGSVDILFDDVVWSVEDEPLEVKNSPVVVIVSVVEILESLVVLVSAEVLLGVVTVVLVIAVTVDEKLSVVDKESEVVKISVVASEEVVSTLLVVVI